MSFKSLQERKQQMLEDGCAACGGGGGDVGGGPPMSVGADGYQADAAAGGPKAGYDPLMKKLKMIKNNRRKRLGNGT